MAAGRASTLLIRIVGDSTGATKALNQVAQAEAVTAEITKDSSKEMVAATSAATAALKAELAVEKESVRMARISADVAEQAARQELQAARDSLKATRLQLSAKQQITAEDKEQVAALQLVVFETEKHTRAMAANAKVARANEMALDKLQQEELELATATDAANASNKGFLASMGKWGPILGAAAAATALVARSASQLEQAVGGLNAVFGEQADEMLVWAESMQQYGFSTTQAATAATILGAQLKNVGIPMDVVAEKTQELIILAGDLAATFGTDVTQALTAMTAAFRGEFEPLEKYGIGLSQAAVNAEILALEQQGVTFETERQAKVVATYNIILAQSADAQGQMAREQETLQQTTNRLKASITNLAAEIGGHLLPILQPWFDALGDIFAKTGELIDENGLLATSADIVTSALESLWAIVEPILIPALEALNSIFDTLAQFLNATVVPVLDAVAKAVERISTAIQNAITWVQNLITELDNLVTWFWENEDTVDAATAATASIATALRRPVRVAGGLSVNQTAGLSNQPPNLTINVTAGVGDPHAIAKEIRKVLQRDAVRMGRVA